MSDLFLAPTLELESFDDQLDLMFHELDLAFHWNRPSIMFAIYNSVSLRNTAQDGLEQIILHSGQSVIHYPIRYDETLNLTRFLSEIASSENKVFYINSFINEGENEPDDHQFISILNSCRGYLADQLVRVVFWLSELEATSMAHAAPDFWTARHRVFEFCNGKCHIEQGTATSLISVPLEGEKMPVNLQNLEARSGDDNEEPAMVLDLPDDEESGANTINLLLVQGVQSWKDGDLAKACEPLNQALALAEKSGNVAHQAMCHKALALVKADSGQVDEAIHSYQKVIELAPENGAMWNNIGVLAQKAGNLEHAEKAFTQALSQDANDPVSWYGLGNVHASNNRLDEAISAYRKAIQFNGGYVAPWSKLGDVLLKKNRSEDALYAYMRSVEMDKKNVHAWEEIGNIYYGASSYDQAIDAYQKAIQLGVNSVTIDINLAKSLVRVGSYSDSISFFQKAISQLGDGDLKVELWNQLGDVHRHINDYDNAVSAYHFADKLIPPTTPMGLEAMEISETETTAISNNVETPAELPAAAEEAQPINPSSSESMENTQGKEMETIQNPEPIAEQIVEPVVKINEEQTVAQVEKAPETLDVPTPAVVQPQAVPTTPSVEPDPESAHLWSRLGRAYMKAGAVERATKAYRKVIDVDPANWQNYSQLAQIYTRQKDLDGAVSTYKLGAEMLPNNKDKAISLGFAGEIYRQKRDYDNALDAYENAIGFDPQNANFLDGLTNIQDDLEQVGAPLLANIAKMTQASETKINVEFNNANIWNELGNVLVKSKAFDGAIQAYQNAIELNPEFGWAYSNIAAIRAKQENYDEAISLYKKSIEILSTGEDQAIAWNRLGDVYRQAGKYNEAMDAYLKADQVSGGSHQTVHNQEDLFTHFVLN